MFSSLEATLSALFNISNEILGKDRTEVTLSNARCSTSGMIFMAAGVTSGLGEVETEVTWREMDSASDSWAVPLLIATNGQPLVSCYHVLNCLSPTTLQEPLFRAPIQLLSQTILALKSKNIADDCNIFLKIDVALQKFTAHMILNYLLKKNHAKVNQQRGLYWRSDYLTSCSEIVHDCSAKNS